MVKMNTTNQSQDLQRLSTLVIYTRHWSKIHISRLIARLGWWCGLAVMHLIQSTKLLYAKPG